MKQSIRLIIFFTVGLNSCNPKMLLQSSFEGKCYQSVKGHLFAGNEICFYSDSVFRYVGHGPSTFVSNGSWKYDKLNNEIELSSISSDYISRFKNRVDTMWVELTRTKIKVKHERQFLFEEVIYKLK
jgi:hypothetical protein